MEGHETGVMGIVWESSDIYWLQGFVFGTVNKATKAKAEKKM